MNRLALELRHLRYFVTLAQELHFGRAAAQLHIVQPALTAQLKALEEIVGVELIERTKRRVELTDAGRQFLKDSLAALAAVDEAGATAQRHARGQIGRLNIGYGANAALSGLMPAAVRRFRAAWPEVSIDLFEMAGSEVVEALASGAIDLGYAVVLKKVDESTVETMSVGRWPWVLAVCDDHRLTRLASVGVEDVRGERVAVYGEPGGRIDLSSLFAAMPGLDLNEVQRSDRFANLMTYVASGLGIAFVPSAVGEVAFPGVSFLPIAAIIPNMEMHVLWRRDRASPVIRNYVSVLGRSRSP
jgi:DNA-binding transcriptional LysR family regulator